MNNKYKLCDEYQTPAYAVRILIPYLKKNPNIRTIWCPCDKYNSKFISVLNAAGYTVIESHIDTGHDFLTCEPPTVYDAIITNPPYTIKHKIINRCNQLGKPWALLLPSTCAPSQTVQREIKEAKDFNFIMIDKRVSYDGSRPDFSSWYFTSQLLDQNEFYSFDEDPVKIYMKEKW